MTQSTSNLRYDAAVVGGGPAGLHAATELGRRGFRVVLFEEHPVIGEPVHCTGLVAAETFEQFDIPTDSVLHELHIAQFYPPSGQMIEYATDRAEALVIDRGLFDRRLFDRACAHGVQARLGVRVRDVAPGADDVQIYPYDGEPIRARVCVLAGGANYSLHRRLGLGMPRVFLQSAQAEFHATRSGHTEVHFGDRVAPKGFAWAVPVGSAGALRVRVGLMCESDAATRFDRFLAGLAPRRGLLTADSNGQQVTPRLKMLPLAPIPRTFDHRLVAVGDAAGLVKATTGGGVYYSLVTAAIAADVLASALRDNELGQASLSRYETGWRNRLGPELDAQLALRSIAQRMNDDEIESIFELARHDGVMPIVRRTARFNEHRDLIVSLFRHPPVRQILLRRLLGRHARPLSPIC